MPEALRVNRTQRITAEWLQHSRLKGEELLLEALLRRGFLAYRDDDGVWLGTGSHPEDIEVLRLIDGLEVMPISDHKDRMARVTSQRKRVKEMDVAIGIIGVPENRSFNGGGDYPSDRWGWGWAAYQNMVWGDKVATCPTRYLHKHELGYFALDLGVALLIKALPLARVATDFFSCDGHGSRPASIVFRFEWDASWGNAVFKVLEVPMPHSNWEWRGGVSIRPLGEFSNINTLGMLNDIQHFARQLLNQTTITKIGRARSRTLATFGKRGPNTRDFADEATRQLAEEFVC
jgi:hypothetical protein